ncbi:MAG TPA: alpha/beta fold hydrolase [Candidatus Binatia bacterium]|nr:alpha/beta fold hydrolase [Candidatus Binatia bacterium]
MREDVEFRSEGVTCRGWWTRPPSGSGGAATRSPAIVLAHGFSAVKEMALDRFADAFAEAGFASLVFDYRGLGSSDGEPRQDLDPHAQIADYRNAISFVRSRSDVDPDRIGIWGSSYSGAHVLMVAALDRRVKAVVSQVPLIDGWETFGRMNGEEARAETVVALIAERERIYAGGAPEMVPVVAPSGEVGAAIPGEDGWRWFNSFGDRAARWRNEVTMRSVERLLEYSPLRWIDRIAPTPLLVVAAEHDFLPIDLTRAAVDRAGAPKQLAVLPAGHFAPYDDPHFGTAAKLAVDWFLRHL